MLKFGKDKLATCIVLQVRHSLDVLPLIVPYSRERIQQSFHFGSPNVPLALFVKVHGIEQVQVVSCVVLLGRHWCWLGSKIFLMFFNELGVGSECLLFYRLIQIVRQRGIVHVQCDHNPVVEDSNVLSNESIDPSVTATHFLHDK